jgi:hypothetical protein
VPGGEVSTKVALKPGRYYRVSNVSSFDRMNAPTTCQHCGLENLKTTVKMVDPTGLSLWMGTGCARRGEMG